MADGRQEPGDNKYVILRNTAQISAGRWLIRWILILIVAGQASVVGAQALQTPREDMWVVSAGGSLGGRVAKVLADDDTIYIAGFFNHVGPNTGKGALLDPVNGELLPPHLMIDGRVEVAVPDESGGWYIGGGFSRMQGLVRNKLARILPDGSVDPNWNPSVINTFGTVHAMAVSDSAVYIGGSFDTGSGSGNVGGQPRNRLARILPDGSVDPDWNPNVSNGSVQAMALSGSTLYIGGTFNSSFGGNVGGEPRNRLARILPDGSVDPDWDPDITSGDVVGLVLSDSLLYVAGSFGASGTIGGQVRHRLARILPDGTVDPDWNPIPLPTSSIGLQSLAMSPDGQTLYVGGLFSEIGDQSRSNLAAIHVSTGQLTSWNPVVNSRVRTITPSGTSVYVGGEFTSVNGEQRTRLALISEDGSVDPTWTPRADQPVFCLALFGSKIFAGGDFVAINGVDRNSIAALDAITGAATPWNQDNLFPPLRTIDSLALSNDGQTLYVGGDFSLVDGLLRNRAAAINTVTGAITDWNPDANSVITSMALSQDGQTVYVGGFFSNIGGQQRSGIAALDAETGLATSWNPVPTFTAGIGIRDIVVSGDTIYVAGSFTSMGGQTRNRLAALNADTALATPWNPNVSTPSPRSLTLSGTRAYTGGFFSSIGGVSRQNLAGVDLNTGLPTPWVTNGANGGVLGLAISGSTLFVGGEFTSVSGQVRRRLAAVDSNTGIATGWRPEPGGGGTQVGTLAVTETAVYAGGTFASMNTIDGFLGGRAQPGFAAFYLDGDGDGAPDIDERGAPNDGDGNNDGIPDWQQNDVASLRSATPGIWITLVAPSDEFRFRNTSVERFGVPFFPENVSTPFARVHFELVVPQEGQTAQLTILYSGEPSPDSVEDLFLWNGSAWISVLADANFEPSLRRFRLDLEDGGPFDLSNDADGTIRGILALGAGDETLLIELDHFSAHSLGVGHPVEIQWGTASEIDNVGFHLDRVRFEGDSHVPAGRVNNAIIPGAGTTFSGADYSFTDPVVITDGEQRGYVLIDIDANGKQTHHGPIRVEVREGDAAGEPEWRAFGWR